jgi:YD repeat-containing protein
LVPRLRIFLSSPADTNWERLRAHLIIRRLARDYRRYFTIEPFLWEYEPMLASQHFQDAVDAPGGFDIVVLTVWSRLGTLLPEKTAVREYRGIDGRAPVTGTEWEFEDALKANRATGGKGPPDLLVYRRRGGAMAALDDLTGRAEAIRQYDALEAFWRRWFKADTGFLAGFADYQDTGAFDRRLEADLRTLIERRIRERHAAPAVLALLANSPFRGLNTYEFNDAPLFFGRHGEIGDGLTRLLDAAERGTAFLLVSGPSGSGKSSLARAGLLPALVAPKTVSGVGLWRRAVMRPGDAGGDPIVALVRALAPDEATDGIGLPELIGKQMTREELAEFLASGGNPAFLFARTLRDLADTERTPHGLLPHEQARLVLLIDQIEELVTRPEITPEQRRLFARIVAALAGSGVVWVIATVRSDLWHRLEDVTELRDLAERGARLTLAAPDAAQLFDIIRKPAQAAGLAFDTEPGTELSLDAMLAREAEAQPGVLPLVSVMLDELYKRDAARGGAMLTVASYRALGGLHVAIGQRAESRLQDLQKTDPAAAAALSRVLRALVTVTAGDAPATRSAPLKRFADASPERRLVEALIAPDARLLTAEDRGHGPEVRLAHEALIENWPRAKAVVAESGHFVRLRDDIDAQRRRWEAGQRRPELLLAGGLPLAEARDLVKKFGAELSPELLTFVRASRGRAHRRLQLVAAAAVLLLIVTGYGVWWWDQNLRIKTQYCANYGERWAVPFCIGPLDAATQGARWLSYRFRTQGGRVLEVTRVSGRGTPVDRRYLSYEDEPWTKGVARWRFSYRSEAVGAELLPASVIMEGSTGVQLREVSYQFSENHREAIARFSRSFDVAERQEAEGSALGLSVLGQPGMQTRSSIGQHRLSFDETGLLLRRDFQPLAGGSTIADALGSYGRVYEYGHTGLPTHIRNLDGQGKTLVDKSGIAGRQYDYDARGDLLTVTWLDGQNRPRANQQAFARVARTYNSIGNIIGEAYYTEAGVLIERSDLGVASLSEESDEHADFISQVYFGTDGRPIVSKRGYARITYRYDERGNEVEEAYFGTDGKPVLSKDGGFARVTYRYDERGNQIEWADFDADGKPVLSKDGGVARMTFHYDERGNKVEEAYFGTDGKPSLGEGGFARVTYRYDERGNQIEWADFGADGKPVLNSAGGIARTTFHYDERGNKVEEAYFGTDGKPVLSKDGGIARTTFHYDERGDKVEEVYFDTDGKPSLGKGGFARVIYRYDERGNNVEEAYFGADGKPVLNSAGGIARTTFHYDERGNNVEEAYFGTDGNPVLNSAGGIARATFRYDERSNKVEEAYFGVHGEPILSKAGVARVAYRFDERGNRIERADFDTDGKPVANKDGVARITSSYDERGNEVERAYFGIDGKPVLSKEGFARITYRYDERGTNVEWADVDADGKPVFNTIGAARATFRYDERGNEVERAYFGIDGKPTLGEEGFARIIYRYDERGNQIEIAYFNTNGKPVANNDGATRVASGYDERSNKVEQAYFGADGKPILNKAGVARVTFGYDERGNQIETANFDTNGKPVADRNGVARETSRHDDRGNETEHAYFGADRKPVLGKEGVARINSRYDERGNQVEWANFDTYGNPVLDTNGVARSAVRYDQRGNEIERAHFGTDGKPILSKEGFARVAYRYDERGSEIERAFFGTDGKPVVEKDGVAARITSRYDERGNLLQRTFFGIDGTPSTGRFGAEVRYDYDYGHHHNEVIGATYFDDRGRIIAVEARIDEIVPGSTAEHMGFVLNDVLLAYDGEPIKSAEQWLFLIVKDAKPGVHKLTVRRSGKIMTYEVPAGRMGIHITWEWGQPTREQRKQ